MEAERFVISSAEPKNTVEIGRVVGRLLKPGNIVLLSGDLGAGKTQLTKGVAEVLGVDEVITSPTFNIMFEHVSKSGVLLRHFDLYRLNDEVELEDIDYFGLLESDAISVVEWGDKYADSLPLDYLKVEFKYDEGVDTSRMLELSAVGENSTRLLKDLKKALHNQILENTDVI